MAIETLDPENLVAWRNWLEANYLEKEEIWLIFHGKSSEKKNISWSEAVDVALCFGWIDSKKVKIDEHSSRQYFCKRKPKSTWSKINKEKIQSLTAQGLMTEAGMKCVEIAQKNGSWNVLDDVEALKVPDDLQSILNNDPIAAGYYGRMSKSSKKMLLYNLVFAKRPETRLKRLADFKQQAILHQKS